MSVNALRSLIILDPTPGASIDLTVTGAVYADSGRPVVWLRMVNRIDAPDTVEGERIEWCVSEVSRGDLQALLDAYPEDAP